MRKLLPLVFLLFFTASAVSQSIGMAPGEYELGEVERGESIDFTLYLTSYGTSRNFTVTPTESEVSLGEVSDNDAVDRESYSEQPISGWIDWDENTFTVNPRTSGTGTLPDGSQVSYNGRMTGNLEVPSNAEPGYHAVGIGLNPDFPRGDGFGASVIGLSRANLQFRVPGEAERSIEVTDVEARRVGENRFQYVVEMTNTGTVTASVSRGEMTLTSSNGNEGSLTFTGASIPPGSSRQVEAMWAQEGISGGSYTVEGSIDYDTDRSFFREDVSITSAPQEPIEVEDPSQQGEGEGPQQASAPLLLIVIAVVGLGSVLYAFGVDILWSFALSGLAGVGIFIITSGLPVHVVLALMVMGAGVLVYLNW